MNSTNYQVDPIDQKILANLVNNARTPFLEIARECGISGAAVHQRVKKMEEAGIIVGSQLIVKPKALGYDICAFVGVQLAQANMYKGVIEILRNIPEVVECHFVTGDYVVLLKVYCRDNDHLMGILINTIQNIPGVSKTNTFMSLDQAFERQVYVKDKRVIKKSKVKSK
ncbi:MAG: Lrp/AsnC ligand binding domain-containing protein [Prevotellaceae bacterium]|jgi:Lrp/AsnC family transcriptional regulator for asnA, asnC and gidA|nr:Lrp/AsnC ligand binding domain-containing protein [Prevotellaceae bacterium]